MVPVQNGGPLNDSKMSNLWTTKPWFEIIYGLLVSVFDKVSNPNSPDLQPNTRHVICKMPFFFWKAEIVQKRKEQAIYFLQQLVGDKVVCSCTELHWKPVECLRVITRWIIITFWKSLTYTEEKWSRKSQGIVLHYQTTRASLFNKSSHTSNCSSVMFG